jgi:hypothetical protein
MRTIVIARLYLTLASPLRLVAPAGDMTSLNRTPDPETLRVVNIRSDVRMNGVFLQEGELGEGVDPCGTIYVLITF